MKQEHYKFLSYVQEYIAENPEVSSYVVQAASAGVTEAMDKIKELALNCESLAVMAMTRRTKNVDSCVLAKLKQINGKSWMNWDSEIEALEAKAKIND